jgi:solute carrier family 25 protein 39/40
MATATQRAEDADKSAGMGEVTLGQKMLSAVSGSILTSLLGAYTQVHIMLEQNHTPSSLVARSHSRTTVLSPCNNTEY